MIPGLSSVKNEQSGCAEKYASITKIKCGTSNPYRQIIFSSKIFSGHFSSHFKPFSISYFKQNNKKNIFGVNLYKQWTKTMKINGCFMFLVINIHQKKFLTERSVFLSGLNKRELVYYSINTFTSERLF